jgi:hypothetical protein
MAFTFPSPFDGRRDDRAEVKTGARLDLLRVVALSFLLLWGRALAETNTASNIAPRRSYNEVVRSELAPHTEQLLMLLAKQGRGLTMQGDSVFDGRDAFLPGKIAVALADAVVSLPRDDPGFPEYLLAFRKVAAQTVDDANDTWGVYYYMVALDMLRQAGLLVDAVDRLTLAKLRVRLDWRTFVDPANYNLIEHANNYYCVAFGIARLRARMGWESGSAAGKLFAKIRDHYHRYSGQYGFADETDGEGRYDRYSVLLAGEIAHHFIESGASPPREALVWLRKSADVMLARMHADGEGFEYGRSLGPYGETAIIEVLTAAAVLGVLTDPERELAYAYATRAAQRFVDFWLDKTTGSVDLWDQGRRTDAYRGRFRRFGENLSLVHQFIYTNALWNGLGYKDKEPIKEFAAALNQLPKQRITWFARGPFDRVLLTRRDQGHIIGLPLIGGGTTQHAHSPYFPIPFSRGMLSGVADGTRPLLLPQFHLSDGSILMPLSFIRAVDIATQQDRTTVRYRQTHLDRLGGESPVADDRLSLASTYVFEPGRITRTDIYTPKRDVDIEGIELDFGSFSDLSAVGKNSVSFSNGAIDEFKVSGFDGCEAQAIHDDPEFESDEGPMAAKVICTHGPRIAREPFTISWTLMYH